MTPLSAGGTHGQREPDKWRHTRGRPLDCGDTCNSVQQDLLHFVFPRDEDHLRVFRIPCRRRTAHQVSVRSLSCAQRRQGTVSFTRANHQDAGDSGRRRGVRLGRTRCRRTTLQAIKLLKRWHKLRVPAVLTSKCFDGAHHESLSHFGKRIGNAWVFVYACHGGIFGASFFLTAALGLVVDGLANPSATPVGQAVLTYGPWIFGSIALVAVVYAFAMLRKRGTNLKTIKSESRQRNVSIGGGSAGGINTVSVDNSG